MVGEQSDRDRKMALNWGATDAGNLEPDRLASKRSRAALSVGRLHFGTIFTCWFVIEYQRHKLLPLDRRPQCHSIYTIFGSQGQTSSSVYMRLLIFTRCWVPRSIIFIRLHLLYVYICVYLSLSIYIYIHTQTCKYTCIHTYICVCMYI